jgi:hypothetical protein
VLVLLSEVEYTGWAKSRCIINTTLYTVYLLLAYFVFYSGSYIEYTALAVTVSVRIDLGKYMTAVIYGLQCKRH